MTNIIRVPAFLITIVLLGGCARTEARASSTQPIPPAAERVPEPAPQWEYITITPHDEVYDSTLNRLGKDGWELVTARRVTVKEPMEYVANEITLKRQSRPDRPKTTAEEQEAIMKKEWLRATFEQRQRAAGDGAYVAFLDPATHLYHTPGCPSVTPDMEDAFYQIAESRDHYSPAPDCHHK